MLKSRLRSPASKKATKKRTVNVYVDGALQTHHAGYTHDVTKDYELDHTTGIITFKNAPSGSPAAVITADFQEAWVGVFARHIR